MDAHYRVQLAEPEHLQFLRDVELAAAQLFSLEDLPEPQRSHTASPDLLIQGLYRQTLWVALEREHETVVGFALVTLRDTHAHLRELAVHPHHGRRGIGRELVNTVIQSAQEQGLQGVTLNTFRHIHWNAPFYQKLGFRTAEDGEGPAYLEEYTRAEQAEGLDITKRVGMYLPFH